MATKLLELRRRLGLRSMALAGGLAGRKNIGQRLALGFGLLLALFAATTAFALLQMKAMERDMAAAIEAHAEIATRAAGMRRSVDDMYLYALQLTLSTDGDDMKYYNGIIGQARKRYEEAKAQLLALTHGGADVAGLQAAVTSLGEYEAVLRELEAFVGRHMAGPPADSGAAPSIDMTAVGYMTGTVRAGIEQWAKVLDQIVVVTATAGRERQTRAEATNALAGPVLLAAAGVTLCIGVLAAWLIARSVTRPIRQAVCVAEQVAQGDLSLAIPAGGSDETGTLLKALSCMQASLAVLVREVRDTAHSIQTASNEVAAGNNDLSQRTEHAAGQLQRTAGSVSQLSDAVRQSAESARTADGLARGAARAAEQGGEAVRQVVQSMQSIAEQSRRVVDIIGVIDGIAFQTNILALNAAVEAARAGEQGRGFAVVAGEVRSLAQRSAAAAKDIKQLIQSSTANVDSGSGLVRGAGQSMDGIVAQVREVTDAITAISGAAVAQSEGVGEVSRSMEEIDNLTQQNAALVEQSAAAAASLNAQATRLAQVVQAFKLA